MPTRTCANSSARYQPALLWNDIDYPKSGHPLEIMAEYYNAVPDGVIDNRFGVSHADFVTPEYETLDKINPKKWEECRGLGRSFGYNRAEGEADTIPRRRPDLSSGRYRQQERQPAARRWPGGRRHHPRGTDGTPHRTGCMAAH